MNPNNSTGPSAQPRNEKAEHAGRGAAYPPQLDQANVDVLRMAANAAVAKAAAAAGPAFKERRRSVRFQCSGTVEFQAEGSDVRLSGSLTDVSLHGCYVEMLTTFPIDTQVILNIKARGVCFHTRAKVRATYPFVGMGMCFEEMELGQQAQLGQLLRSIAADRALLNLPSIEHPNLPDIVASADPSACFEAISNFFQRNTSLSRDEFLAIAKRVRRS